MTRVVVADAGPLIALARIGRLGLLREMYGDVRVPPTVLEELQIASTRPGAVWLAEAVDAGWITVSEPDTGRRLERIEKALDRGEAEAIHLAERVECRFLLIDDRRGRSVATSRGVPVVGIAGVVLAAKERGLVEEVAAVLDDLAQVGYRLSDDLRRRVVKLAGESS